MSAPPVASPRTLDAALRALANAGPSTRPLSGGTDLMVELAVGRTNPDLVIDVWRVDELRGIRAEHGGVRLGALSTCRELIDSPLVRERAGLLAIAADQVGAEQIKNRATLGGNLGTASPASDLGPVLFALDARVRLVSLGGARELSIDEFWTGYRATARRSDELIESIWVPERPRGEHCVFRKVGTRAAQSIAKVVVALAVAIEDGRVLRLRAAAGSVAERVVRLDTLERALVGHRPDLARIGSAARASADADIRPVDDVRSTARYRREVLARVAATLLATACDLAQPDRSSPPLQP